MPSEQDLEDFSTAHGGELSGYVSALHVANFLRFGMIFKLKISMFHFFFLKVCYFNGGDPVTILETFNFGLLGENQ